MRHSLLAGLMALLLTGCTILSPQEEAHYRSRVYNLSQSIVFDAVKVQMIEYTMALATVDPAKGLLKSQPSGVGHSAALAGGTVGYQLTVQVEPVTESSARVTPAWAMNVSSEAFRPNLVAIPIEHRPILYVDFFDALDTRLGLNTAAR